MASQLVRIDDYTHAKLRAWAEQEHKPIGRIVAELVDRHESENFWRAMHESYAELQADPPIRPDHRMETRCSKDCLVQDEPYYSPEEEAEIERYAKSQGW